MLLKISIKSMKKYLFLFFALIVSYQIHAQMNLGLMGGTNFSNLRIRNVPELVAPLLPSEYQPTYAFYIGGFANFSLSEMISLSPELYYANRGWEMVYDQLSTTFRSTDNTIVLPLLVRFNFLKKLHLYTGPELSYVVKNNIKDLTNGNINLESTSDRSFDLALSAGVAFDLIKNLAIDLRYNFGLLDQQKAYEIPGEFIDPGLAGQLITVDYDAYNWSIQLGLKYRFLNKD
jgi:opacity protein-like surface antigen